MMLGLGISPSIISSIIASFLNVLASIVSTDIVVTATSSIDLSAGTWGFDYSFTDATLASPWTKSGAGAAASQSLTVPAVDLNGYSASATLYVRAWYSLTNPADVIVPVGSIFTLTAP